MALHSLSVLEVHCC